MRRGNPWPRCALVACLPAAVWAGGCDRDGDVVVSATPATVPAATTNRTFATPFVGHVTARETLGPLVVGRVSYTIDAKRIRREKTDHSDVVTEHVARMSPRSGVIVDLTRNRAILYTTYLDRRVAVELTLDEYDRHVGHAGGPRVDGVGFGTSFLYLSGPSGVRTTTNAPAATHIDGVPCDVLRIDSPVTVLDVHHAPGMVVDRGLIERVEPGIPPQVTGFPLRIYPLDAVGSVPPASNPSRVEQLAGRALRATTRATTALKTKLDAVAIDVTIPDSGAFEIPAGFERCKDLPEYIGRSQPSGSGGGFDFD